MRFRWRSPLLAVAAAGVAVAAAGCGATDGAGADAAGGAGNRSQFREAALEYAQCMRDNGVDMPDPQPGERGLVIGGPDGPNPDAPGFEQAQERCRSTLEDLPTPQISEEQQEEFQQAALAFARCMRENGIDMPDPQFQDGRSAMRIGGPGLNPRDPAFQSAQEKCRDELPDAAGPGGPGGP